MRPHLHKIRQCLDIHQHHRYLTHLCPTTTSCTFSTPDEKCRQILQRTAIAWLVNGRSRVSILEHKTKQSSSKIAWPCLSHTHWMVLIRGKNSTGNFAKWLVRTDANALVPLACILPSLVVIFHKEDWTVCCSRPRRRDRHLLKLQPVTAQHVLNNYQ